MKVEQITPKSNSLGDLQDYIAQLSSVVRDKSPKSAEKLFNRLLKESVGDKASRVLEYIPCKITIDKTPKEIRQWFGFFSDDGTKYYTNARELLNWGWTLEDVLKTVDFTNYAVVRIEAPYFLYSQGSTHTQITTISHSQRYAECDRGYWCPPEVAKKLYDEGILEVQPYWDVVIKDITPKELINFMKECGINRKEVFDRGADSLQNRVYIFGAYTNNPNAWGHFIAQRTDKHTQLEMRILANMIKDEISIVSIIKQNTH